MKGFNDGQDQDKTKTLGYFSLGHEKLPNF